MNRPWLAPGISPRDRVAAVCDHIEGMGWRISWRAGRVSYANPLTRRIVVSVVARDALDFAALLAHEAAHARWMGGRLMGAPRVLWYLLSPWCRVRQEVEARAEACAVLLAGGATPDYSAGSLAGWRLPYLTGASAERVERWTRERAAAVSGAVSGLSGPAVSSRG